MYQNILVSGLYYGPSKAINFHDLLYPLCQELDHHGIIKYKHEEIIYHFQPVIMYCVMDMPARAKILNMVAHNGKESCIFCMHPGVSIESKTSTIVRYTWQADIPAKRTPKDIIDTMLNIRGTEIVNGIKGVSALVAFKNFDIVDSIGLDYLHCILHGVVEKILDLWLNSHYSKKEFYLNKAKQVALNQLITHIKPPREINRKPSAVTNPKKANEVRSDLLYYLPIVLNGLQKTKYLNHFKLLSSTIYTLLQTRITAHELNKCNDQLILFLKNFELLYGLENVTPKFHLALHLIDRVRVIGPLWAQSMFSLETMNGILVKSVKGTTSVLRQIASSYVIKQSLRKKCDRNNLQCCKFLGARSQILIADKWKAVILQKVRCASKIPIFKRLQLDNDIYTCSIYKQTKSIDYFVQFSDLVIGKIYFFFEIDDEKFVLFERFRTIGTDYHISEIEAQDYFEVKNVLDIKRKCIYIEKKSIVCKKYITFFPNNYEQT